MCLIGTNRSRSHVCSEKKLLYIHECHRRNIIFLLCERGKARFFFKLQYVIKKVIFDVTITGGYDWIWRARHRLYRSESVSAYNLPQFIANRFFNYTIYKYIWYLQRACAVFSTQLNKANALTRLSSVPQ